MFSIIRRPPHIFYPHRNQLKRNTRPLERETSQSHGIDSLQMHKAFSLAQHYFSLVALHFKSNGTLTTNGFNGALARSKPNVRFNACKSVKEIWLWFLRKQRSILKNTDKIKSLWCVQQRWLHLHLSNEKKTPTLTWLCYGNAFHEPFTYPMEI